MADNPEQNKINYSEISKRLNETAKKYLDLIKNEYGKYMSDEQRTFLNILLNSDCIKVEQEGNTYLQNQAQEINNLSMSEEDKKRLIDGFNIPLAHGGRVFNDNLIHFYPFILLEKNPNLSEEEIIKICESVLVHELLHFFIRLGFKNNNNMQLASSNNFVTEGLVDMCTRDIFSKYGMNPNYTSDYGKNVLFARKALANIAEEEDRMRLIFGGSLEQFFNLTSTQDFNSYDECIKSQNGHTPFDELVSSICSICGRNEEEKRSMERSLYNFSANFSNVSDAITGIYNTSFKLFPDKVSLIDEKIKLYSDKDKGAVRAQQKPKMLIKENPDVNEPNSGFANILILIFIIGMILSSLVSLSFMLK